MAEKEFSGPQTPNLQELIFELKEIRSRFVQNIADLEGTLAILKPQSCLSGCSNSLQTNKGSYASNLEREVRQLREELEAIRAFLHLDQEE